MLNDVQELELELVARKIIKQEKEMQKKGERYLSEKEALSKYKLKHKES